MKKLLLLILLTLSFKVFSYPHYIGHGYPSCFNCHFNPFGGGTLNDYGRAVGATAMAADHLYPSSWDNEKVAYHSGFLFRPPKQKYLRNQINYRGFTLIRNPGSSETEKTQWITMQLDGRAVLKFGDRDQYIMSGSISYTPRPSSPTPGVKDESDIRSREYYLGYRPTPSFGIYAGLMDKVYGIRVVEHIAYSRMLPQVTQNDQTHGVAFHYLNHGWEGGLHLFLGNLNQEEDVQMKGASFLLEKTLGEIHRVGGSVMRSENEYLTLTAVSGQARVSLKDGSSVQAELGQVMKQSTNGLVDTTSRYALIQTYLKPIRGLYLLTNIEYLQNDIESEEYTMRWGPALQYLPIQRTEFRVDLYNTRNFNPKTSVKDTWLLMFQTHIWL